MIEYGYDRKDIRTGIVHFGVGNFHRAHLEYYTNLLLQDPSQHCWGVFGAMIMPSDEKLYRALKEDSCIYRLTTCSPDGENTEYSIGSLIDVAYGLEEQHAIVERIAAPETKIITLTITEGGYRYDADQTGSVFWYVAEGLLRRMEANLPITILSCDNLQHNGDTAAAAFTGYFSAKYPELVPWVAENVTFPNSMVDRITPAARTGKLTDVCCEDFIQWVIEDKFIAGRPLWENIGVQFTDNVDPYENMKLSLLNASHSLLCYPAYLEGYRKVDAVLADRRYYCLIKDFMDIDVTPYVPSPGGIDLDEYKETLLKRFSNSAISDQVSRLCGDGAAKFPVYIVPTLKKMISDGRDISRLAFLIAAYCRYLMGGKAEDGEAIDVFEPHLTENDKEVLSADSHEKFLSLSPFEGLGLEHSRDFMDKYNMFLQCSISEGLEILI